MASRLTRKLDSFLTDWLKNPHHLPLIVRGARQVGKTEAIEHFAQRNFSQVIEINFALQKEYRDIFDDGLEVNAILKNITLKNPSELGIEMNPVQEKVLMKGLSVFGKDRYQNMEELKKICVSLQRF